MCVAAPFERNAQLFLVMHYNQVLIQCLYLPSPLCLGLWLGVEWDNPDRGKHNGSHEGVHYFTCRPPKGGSLVRPKKASFGVDYLTAIRRHYEMEIQISTRTVEMVGFEAISEKQK
ncbi:unnamed protein product [Oncorhynchus mykiss]|uniref:CAP-Gly domain-containing protein n=1 Tax=Oncorhynchus mykiss TaxID=8022 RepID=A0A060YK84_ONCMY|nr:unnamed protein product [Oncorhynchus mykiss]